MSDTESECSETKPQQAKQKCNNKKEEAENGKGKRGKKDVKKETKKEVKKKKESKSNANNEEAQFKEMVFDYMEKQNRPYNVLNVFDNLHAKIKKPVLEAILNDLVEETKLSCKEFGKNKVYYMNQQTLNASLEAVDALNKQYAGLRTEEAELAETYKRLMEDYKKLTNKKTIDEIKQAIIDLQFGNAILQKRKQRITSAVSENVDQKTVIRIQEEEKYLRKEFNKRKKITKAGLSLWSQILEKKIIQVAEIMGIQL